MICMVLVHDTVTSTGMHKLTSMPGHVDVCVYIQYIQCMSYMHIHAPTRERTCGRLLPFLRGFNALVILVTPQSSVPMATLTLALFTISFFFSPTEAALPSTSFFLVPTFAFLLPFRRSDSISRSISLSVAPSLDPSVRPFVLPLAHPSVLPSDRRRPL